MRGKQIPTVIYEDHYSGQPIKRRGYFLLIQIPEKTMMILKELFRRLFEYHYLVQKSQIILFHYH